MPARGPKLDKLIDAWDPVLQKAFIDAIGNLRDAAQLDKLTEAMAAGDVEKAIRAVGLDPVAFRAFDKALAEAFEASGVATSDKLPIVRLSDGFKVEFQFNIRNPDAERWLQDESSQLVKEILDDQRTLIQNHLRAGLAAGDNPRTTALDLVGRIGPSGRRENSLIGLTSSQAEWVRNYEEALRSDNPTDALDYQLRDARFDSLVESGDLSDDDINKMVDSYQNRALRYRAESIARTETIAAMHEAQDQSMKQAIATGALPEEAVTYVWHATHDKRTRPSHAAMDGQEIKMGEKFETGDGNFIEFPGDPNAPASETVNCRCYRETRVDFLADIE